MRRAVLWSAAFLSLTSTLILAAICQGPARVRVGPDWTAERLAKEIGEGWESRPCPDGVLLRRPACSLSWEDLADTPHLTLPRQRGVLLIVGRGKIDIEDQTERPADGTLRLGRLAVHGHPSELQQLLDRFDP